MQRRLLAVSLHVPAGVHALSAGVHVRTGFLFGYGRALYWITAGHVLEELELAVARLGSEALRLRWEEIPRAIGPSVPVAWEALERHRDLEGRIDLGVVKLDRNTAAILRANPSISPYRLADLISRQRSGASRRRATLGAFVVGYPRDWIETEQKAARPRRLNFSAGPVAVPVERVVPRDDLEDSNPFHPHAGSEFAVVSHTARRKERALGSLVGVSGGPALVVVKNRSGRPQDLLWGVQSSWLAESKMIRVEPIEWVVGFLAFLARGKRPG